MADATGHLIRSMDPCRMGRTDFEPSREFRDCLDLLPQERLRGVWYVGFEDMSFVPGAVSAPAVRVMDSRAARAPWIELDMPRGVGERLAKGDTVLWLGAGDLARRHAADFEPGRHWVYGSVRVGSQPLRRQARHAEAQRHLTTRGRASSRPDAGRRRTTARARTAAPRCRPGR